MFRLLLKHGASVAVTNKQGDTVLHLACRNACDLPTVRALLDASDGPTALPIANHRGDTPLHDAARSCISPEVVRTLVMHGADPTRPNVQGDSPADIAQRIGNSRAAHVLRTAACNRPPLPDEKRRAFDDWLEVSNSLPSMSVRGRQSPQYPYSITNGRQSVDEEQCVRAVAYQTGRESPSHHVGDKSVRGEQPLHYPYSITNGRQPVEEVPCVRAVAYQTERQVADHHVGEESAYHDVTDWGGFYQSNNWSSVGEKDVSPLYNDVNYRHFPVSNLSYVNNSHTSEYVHGNEMVFHNSGPAWDVPTSLQSLDPQELPQPPLSWVAGMDSSGMPQFEQNMFVPHINQNVQFLHLSDYEE